MNFIDFPGTNRTLKAGDNAHTRAMRIAVSSCEGYPDKYWFCVSKWELSDQEKEIQRNKFKEALKAHFDAQQETLRNVEDVLDVIMNSMQPLWLSMMGTPPPVAIFSGINPFEVGFKPLDLPPQKVDPKDN